MLHAVLDKTLGHLMEMRHLLIDPKYKELWGKSYTKELGHFVWNVLAADGDDSHTRKSA
jgi:hypothetical protein